MDEEFLSRVHASWERAEKCTQRAARLVLQASVLKQRFDELEHEERLRIAMAQGRSRRQCPVGPNDASG